MRLLKSHTVLALLGVLGLFVIALGCSNDGGNGSGDSNDNGGDTNNGSDTGKPDDSDTGKNNGSDTGKPDDSGRDTNSDSVPSGPVDLETACNSSWGVYDAEFGVCWRRGEVFKDTWYQALEACDDLVLGGHSDWILPTRQDFVNLLGGCDDDVLQMRSGYCDTCFGNVDSRCNSLFSFAPTWTHIPRGWTSETVKDRDDVAWKSNVQIAGQLKDMNIFFTCLRRVK
ncbi:MAG: DUF1566 domain-containing protein [Myxococcales bacterium]|jgi:hypothetical protein|nr:DUF1566 domain-containing protein [Myxococcales bacterium]